MFMKVHNQYLNLTKKIKEGMILSNEPGYYKKGHYGIRIENLIYAKNIRRKYFNFENLTLAPLEKDLINYDLLIKMKKIIYLDII